MKLSVTNAPVAELENDALILAIPRDSATPSPWEALDARVGGLVSAAIAGPGFHGKRGQTLTITTTTGPAKEIVLVGLGPAEPATLEDWRRAVATGISTARRRGNRRIGVPLASVGDVGDAELAAAAAEAAVLGAYRYEEYKPAPPERATIDELQIASPVDVRGAVDRARVIADATCWARDLINTPSDAKRPDVLAEIGSGMARDRGLPCEIVDAEKAGEIGLNGLLAVGSGSAVDPRMVIFEHRPEGVEGPPTVLVGKGITFDSGGISLKPAKSMADMKTDMSGAAAVYGAMSAIAQLDLRRWVVGVTPLAENLPGASAYRPSDIIRAYGGTTIEVINTDAEGRVVLADALAYARQRYEPAQIVDLATLTGACVVALGSAAAGLVGNTDSLCDALVAAGESTGERLWRLPAWDVYDKDIDSEVANVRNSAGRGAGAITAAKFLQRFVGDTPWAHLDIAGTARISTSTPYQPKGGTGFGVRLLTHWLGA